MACSSRRWLSRSAALICAPARACRTVLRTPGRTDRAPTTRRERRRDSSLICWPPPTPAVGDTVPEVRLITVAPGFAVTVPENIRRAPRRSVHARPCTSLEQHSLIVWLSSASRSSSASSSGSWLTPATTHRAASRPPASRASSPSLYAPARGTGAGGLDDTRGRRCTRSRMRDRPREGTRFICASSADGRVAEVDDGRGVERQELAHQEAAHDRDPERPSQLVAGARPERERESAQQRGHRRHQDRAETQHARLEDRVRRDACRDGRALRDEREVDHHAIAFTS